MASATDLKPDYLFKISWEVCNKVGGIHTVLTTLAHTLEEGWGDKLIFVGPDVWKGTGPHPEFTEDKALFACWKEQALKDGLRIRTGRWNIPGNPLVMLIDFTPYFLQKDEILTALWIKFHLDSLSGQWDYIEPALFGYGAGEVIASFYQFHLNSTDKIIAHFHEWMTGAGVLYLEENVPQVATVFTTHATVMGRTVAGNGLPLYNRLSAFNTEQIARDFNVVSKHSLEKIAAGTADCFTCVSEITSRECEKFLAKAPDFIIHNGFDNSIVPGETLFAAKRTLAREKILRVTSALLNRQLPEDSLLVVKSGRYEFRNKGIDIFIDSLSRLREYEQLKKQVVALILVPAHHTGPVKELLERMNKSGFSGPPSGEILTHYLQGAASDQILTRIRENNLDNVAESNVKVVFAPVYLDGIDGIFNLSYYDLLIGFDLGVFPSYYEPWGYTPLESLAFHVPAVTTNVSGFGRTVSEQMEGAHEGLYIIERNDDNQEQAAGAIADIIVDFAAKSDAEKAVIRESAGNMSRKFLWEPLSGQYKTAYNFALQKSLQREEMFRSKPPAVPPVVVSELLPERKPVWRELEVQFRLPGTLAALDKISRNLWWSWNTTAMELFEYIDADLWCRCKGNPVVMLHLLTRETIRELEKDTYFLTELKSVEDEFDRYLATPAVSQVPSVAYFSMEYGLHTSLKLYAGGLGVLAGDFLKQASDNGMNMIGVGLLYKSGYFKQRFSQLGEQIADPDSLELNDLPVYPVNDSQGNPVMIQLAFPGRKVCAKVWKISVGKVPLFLLDTDIDENSMEDRLITSRLYSNDKEIRLKQEILLGIGGVKMLDTLSIKPDVYHCNEGHAAFTGLERIHNMVVGNNMSFEEGAEVVKSSTLFTTHTSVPAAMDTFSEDLLRIYLSYMADDLDIDWSRLMSLGKANENDKGERFSMLYLSARLSQEINAVSKIHQKVSARLLNVLWKDFKPEELYIGSVTNGIHCPTWVAKEWQDIYKLAWGTSFLTGSLHKKDFLEKINAEVTDSAIWKVRISLKRKLVRCLQQRLRDHPATRYEYAEKTGRLLNDLDVNPLFIGFARRFTAYKRPALLFTDIQRLTSILNNAERPARFIFAGKAHPNDKAGVDMLRMVVELSQKAELSGKILFLEDYDMETARNLVQGVDVWLNTPQREMEASGTSGMKAAMNGALNFSVRDGWWAEAYREDIGWTLDEKSIHNKEELQDKWDAETIYRVLEDEIIPLYFNRQSDGLPVDWIKRIKTSIACIVPEFTMERALAGYRRYYNKLYERTSLMRADNYGLVSSLVFWKKRVLESWQTIRVISIEQPDDKHTKYAPGEEFQASITLDTGKLSANDIGIEAVFAHKGEPTEHAVLVSEFSETAINGEEVTYQCNVTFSQSGMYEYGFRIFPKNSLLPNRQDLGLITWA